ncbi:MAG: tyrosine-type recombinase/integrase [Planctomycetota bacterium]
MMPGLGGVCDAFVEDCRARGRAEKTVTEYCATLRRFCQWLDEHDGRLRRSAVREWVLELQDGVRSVETVRTYARTLRVFLRWCHERHHTRHDLARDVPMPRKPVRKPKASVAGALEALLATCADDLEGRRDRALILLLADTGARASEICGLRVEDLAADLSTATVTGKGDKQRDVYFCPITRASLVDWLAVKLAGPLFPCLRGPAGALSANGLRHMLRRRARAAGIAGPTNPHSWRHSFALAYLRNGADIVSLAALLGHSDLTVTREYLRWTDTDLQTRHDRYSPLNGLTLDKQKGAVHP